MSYVRLSSPIPEADVPTLLDAVNAAIDRVVPGARATWVDEDAARAGKRRRIRLLAGVIVGTLLTFRWLNRRIRSDAVVDAAPPADPHDVRDSRDALHSHGAHD